MDAGTNGHKLLNGHLFRFTTKSNGTLKAVEVDNYPAVANVADSGKLHSIASLAVYKNTQIYTAPSTLVVNANTVFLVRSGAGTTASPIPSRPSPASPTSTTMLRLRLTTLT